jgi:hypothetical protein
MSQWNQNVQQQQQQWGAYPQGGYQTMPAGAPNPGYSQPYAPPPPPQQQYNMGYNPEKDPYAGGRFKPKKKVNDVFFLLFFLAQVRMFLPHGIPLTHFKTAPRVCCIVRLCPLYVDAV